MSEERTAPELEDLPDWASKFKVTYNAVPAVTANYVPSRLVQAHFSIPKHFFSEEGVNLKIANHIWSYLISRFKLILPAKTMEDACYEITAAIELRDGKDDRELIWQGASFRSETSNLLWPRQKLESPIELATSLKYALEEDNVQRVMVGAYKSKRNRTSNLRFQRILAVVVVVLFMDAKSSAGVQAVGRQKGEHLPW